MHEYSAREGRARQPADRLQEDTCLSAIAAIEILRESKVCLEPQSPSQSPHEIAHLQLGTMSSSNGLRQWALLLLTSRRHMCTFKREQNKPFQSLLASLQSSCSSTSSSLLRRIYLFHFRSTYNWYVHSISPLQDLQNNQVIDGSCMPTTLLLIESSLLPKSVNLYEIPEAVHVIKYILALSVLLRASLGHK